MSESISEFKSSRPILTIFTRHLTCRTESFQKCVASIQPWIDSGDVQHLVVYDDFGVGYANACKLVTAHKEEAVGTFVMSLDDDDKLFCKKLPKILKELKTDYESKAELKNFGDAYGDSGKIPDIIIARCSVHSTCIVPSKHAWATKDLMSLKIDQSGLPHLIMSNAIFQEYIHNISLRDAYNHDFDIITAWQRDMKAGRKFKIHWLDEILIKQHENQTYEQWKSKKHDKFIILTFYTPDYAKYLPEWERLAKATGYPYIAKPIADLGQWNWNDAQKAQIILDTLNAYPDKNVAWVDIDGAILKKPILFNEIEADFAGRHWIAPEGSTAREWVGKNCVSQDLWTTWHNDRGNIINPPNPMKSGMKEGIMLGATLWFANNARMKRFIRLWIQNCQKDEFRNSLTADQDALNKTLYDHADAIGLKFWNLPFTYCYCYHHHGLPRGEAEETERNVGDAVIAHKIVSLQHRRDGEPVNQNPVGRMEIGEDGVSRIVPMRRKPPYRKHRAKWGGK